MSTFFSLSGFEAATDADVKQIDARRPDAPGELSYDVKKSLDMGWQIATGTDKQTFNATYSTMPADVAAKVATWSALLIPPSLKPKNRERPRHSRQRRNRCCSDVRGREIRQLVVLTVVMNDNN